MSSQEILDKIKALSSSEDLAEETPEEEPSAVDVSEDDTLSDDVVDSVEELEESDEDFVEEELVDEESYFDIDGEEISLSELREWKQSGLRLADYTRKTTAVADTRKELEAKSAKQDAIMNMFNDKVDALDGLISEQEASINWDELADEDPAEYLKQQRKLDAKKAKLKEAKALQEEQFTAKLAEESEILIGKMPTWSDPQVRDSEFKSAVDYAAKIGMDLTEVSDHRVYMALVHASKFDAIDSKKALTEKKVRKAPKAIKATKSKAKAKPTALEDAKARLRKSGSKQDAIAAIRQLYN